MDETKDTQTEDVKVEAEVVEVVPETPVEAESLSVEPAPEPVAEENITN